MNGDFFGLALGLFMLAVLVIPTILLLAMFTVGIVRDCVDIWNGRL